MFLIFYETILDGIVPKSFQDQLNGFFSQINRLRAYKK